MVSFGEVGALGAATCTPTRTVCPCCSDPAQSLPVQVMLVLGFTVQSMPHAFTTDVAAVSGQVTVQPEAFAAAVSSISAT